MAELSSATVPVRDYLFAQGDPNLTRSGEASARMRFTAPFGREGHWQLLIHRLLNNDRSHQ